MTEIPATLPSTERAGLIGLAPDSILQTFFCDPDWVLKSAIGGVMNATSLLMFFWIHEFPALVLLIFSLWAINTGYVLRTVRQSLQEPPCKLPVWNDWLDLFVSGMSWLAIMTGIMILVFFILATDLLIASIFSSMKANQLFAFWVSASIVTIVSGSAFFNLLLAAMKINFAKEENTIAAFSYIKVLRLIARRPGDFVAAWMLALGIQFLSVLVPCVTVIGVFFLPSTIFAGQLISASILAQAWTSATNAQNKDMASKELVLNKDDSLQDHSSVREQISKGDDV